MFTLLTLHMFHTHLNKKWNNKFYRLSSDGLVFNAIHKSHEHKESFFMLGYVKVKNM